MTPHERAKQATAAITPLAAGWGWQDAVTAIITIALQAQSNEDEARHREKQADLRDLLAQQSKRADELQAKLEKHIAYIRTMECELHAEKARADAAEAERAAAEESLRECRRIRERMRTAEGFPLDECIMRQDSAEKARDAAEAALHAHMAITQEELDDYRAREARLREALESSRCYCYVTRGEKCFRCKALEPVSNSYTLESLAGGDHE